MPGKYPLVQRITVGVASSCLGRCSEESKRSLKFAFPVWVSWSAEACAVSCSLSLRGLVRERKGLSLAIAPLDGKDALTIRVEVAC